MFIMAALVSTNGNILHHFIHIPPKFSLKYLVSLETLLSPLEFKIKSCGFMQCPVARTCVFNDGPTEASNWDLQKNIEVNK